MQKRYKRYNADNLPPFTTDNTSYYGSRGGYASGKSKLLRKIDTTRLQIVMISLELDIIKSQVHYYKILNNRYNKLVDRQNQKYGVIV